MLKVLYWVVGGILPGNPKTSQFSSTAADVGVPRSVLLSDKANICFQSKKVSWNTEPRGGGSIFSYSESSSFV